MSTGHYLINPRFALHINYMFTQESTANSFIYFSAPNIIYLSSKNYLEDDIVTISVKVYDMTDMANQQIRNNSSVKTNIGGVKQFHTSCIQLNLKLKIH